MSATLIMNMCSKKEAEKLKDFIFAKNGGKPCNIIAPKHFTNPDKVRCRGAYVDIPSVYAHVGLDYAIWDSYTGDFVMYLVQEMIAGEHFRVRRAGWDSIGFCKSVNDFMRGRGFWGHRMELKTLRKLARSTNPADVKWRKDRWPKRNDAKLLMDQYSKDIRNGVACMKRAAKRFFREESSDLILGLEE